MSFVFPLFLFAGIFLSIPIILHLFNLRKFKKVSFSNTHFLQSFVVKNKRLSETQKKWLLAMRLLLLAFLIIAFAQPFVKNTVDAQSSATIIYVDNSLSMNARNGQVTTLDKVKTDLIEWVKTQQHQEIYLITNDDNEAQLLNQVALVEQIKSMKISPFKRDNTWLLQQIQSIKKEHFISKATVFILSDCQSINFKEIEHVDNDSNDEYLILPYSQNMRNNIALDRVDLNDINEQELQIITSLRSYGNNALEVPLYIKVNNVDVISKVITFNEIDTLLLDTSVVYVKSNKNDIFIQIQEPFNDFDNQYYSVVENNATVDVCIINQSSPNIYLQKFFVSQPFIKIFEKTTQDILSKNNQYAVTIFQGIQSFDERMIKAMQSLLDNGNRILLTFHPRLNIDEFNAEFTKLVDARIQAIDTNLQTVVALQQSHELLKNVFKKIPDNVQLPVTHHNYQFKLGITSGAEDVMKLRDGSPLVTQLKIGKGIIYLINTPLDASLGNLVTSHYFAPLLYNMIMGSGHNGIYNYILNEQEPYSFNWNQYNNGQSVLKIVGHDRAFIPQQSMVGTTMKLLMNDQLNEAGWYDVVDEANNVVHRLGVNYDRIESDVSVVNLDMLSKYFPSVRKIDSLQDISNKLKWGQVFPLWKLALILVLLLLLIESWMIFKASQKK